MLISFTLVYLSFEENPDTGNPIRHEMYISGRGAGKPPAKIFGFFIFSELALMSAFYRAELDAAYEISLTAYEYKHCRQYHHKVCRHEKRPVYLVLARK